MKIKEIIVVEGKADTTKIKQIMNADTIETNGSAINKEVLEQIRHAKEKRGIIIFTDPDYPGERIRHIIHQAIPGCKHAFLTQDEARAKNPNQKSLGIEHASPNAIRNALSKVYELTNQTEDMIKKEDLLKNRLIGVREASERRRRLGEFLNIGHTNGKQLLKRLNQFEITYEEFKKAVQAIDEEDDYVY